MSFFDKELNYNTFDKIIDHTYDEFFKEASEDLTSFTEQDVNPIGRALEENPLNKLLFKVSYSDQAHRLGNKYHKHDMWAQNHQQNNINRDRNLEMNKIEAKLTIEEALPIIQNIRSSVGDNFYGAILIKNDSSRGNSNATINPLNPLVALALKEAIDKQEKSFLKYQYSIIIYTIKDTEQMRMFKEEQAAEGYIEDIKDIMVAAHLSENITVEYSNARRFGQTRMKYDVRRRDSNGIEVRGDHIDKCMVPIQISNTSGMMYPCYGTALFDGRNAKNMSPHMSANIGVPSNTDGSWSNVCAGSLNASSDAGKITLNHSNNTSPLNSNNFGRGGIQYAQACVDIALQLLTGIDGSIASEPEAKRQTLVEFKAENEGASISDYIEYIRALNISELPNWE